MTKVQDLWKVITFVTLLVAALIYVIFFAAAPVSGSRTYPTPAITVAAVSSSGEIPNIESFVGEKFWKDSVYPARTYTEELPRRYPRNNAVSCTPSTPITFSFKGSQPETYELNYVYVLEKTYDITKLSEEFDGTVYQGAYTLPSPENALSDVMYINLKATFKGGNYVNYFFAVVLER